MTKFLSRRVGAALVLLLVITALTYLLMSLAADPARAILGPQASSAAIAAERHALGLDQFVGVRYLHWLGDALHGDLGASWFTGTPVTATIAAKLPITVSLALLATLVSAVLGVGIGLAAAIRRGWLDRAVQVLATLGFAVPGLWLALLLVVVFAVRLRWLPATGYVPLSDDPGQWLSSLILPVIAIAVGSVAAVAAQTRNAALSIVDSDFVRTLRSRGLPRRRLLLRHVLRNCAPVALTVISLQFISLLSGAIVVEQVFALQGLGSLASSSVSQSDVPVVLGVVVVGVLVVLAVNLLLDLAIGWLDPRVRSR